VYKDILKRILSILIAVLLLVSLPVPDNVHAAGNIDDSKIVESPHNYTNNYQKSWEVTVPGAVKIRAHFVSGK
jgi:hypothetical protein